MSGPSFLAYSEGGADDLCSTWYRDAASTHPYLVLRSRLILSS